MNAYTPHQMQPSPLVNEEIKKIGLLPYLTESGFEIVSVRLSEKGEHTIQKRQPIPLANNAIPAAQDKWLSGIPKEAAC